MLLLLLAWCDRILWRQGESVRCSPEDVSQLKYFHSMEQIISDHKPVYSHFKFFCNVKDEIKYSEVFFNANLIFCCCC